MDAPRVEDRRGGVEKLPPSFAGLPIRLAGIATLMGVLAGVGLFTFQYAEGFSYKGSESLDAIASYPDLLSTCPYQKLHPANGRHHLEGGGDGFDSFR